jgi:hypothetical protein
MVEAFCYRLWAMDYGLKGAKITEKTACFFEKLNALLRALKGIQKITDNM